MKEDREKARRFETLVTAECEAKRDWQPNTYGGIIKRIRKALNVAVPVYGVVAVVGPAGAVAFKRLGAFYMDGNGYGYTADEVAGFMVQMYANGYVEGEFVRVFVETAEEASA